MLMLIARGEGGVALLGAAFMVIMIIVVVAINYSTAVRKKLVATMRIVAGRHDGRVVPGGMWSVPKLFFPCGGEACFDYYSTGGKHPVTYTRLTFTLPFAVGNYPDGHLRVEVYPEGIGTSIGKFFGMEDIEIGSRTFDDYYMIRGNSIPRIRELLTPEAQKWINRIRRMLNHHHVYVQIKAGQLLILKLGQITTLNDIDRFISNGKALYEALTATSGEGIEFVGTATAVAPNAVTIGPDTVCQICGDMINSDVVKCVSCQTIHHGSCWEYVGGCSTYGCGQRQFKRL